MRGWLLVAALLLVPSILAQPEGTVRQGPEVSVLVHHPNDGVDALGFAYRANKDAFFVRHGNEQLFADTVAFPGFIADGMIPFEGLPQSDEPLAATVALYEGAVQFRLEKATPISFRIATTGAGMFWNASVAVGTDTPLPESDLRLWTALVEDPVHYRPPSGLTNGVFDHPFTVRAIQELGAVQPLPGTPDVRTVPIRILPEWDPERVLVVAWVEQGSAESPRFEAGEVVQATNHPLVSDIATVQLDRGVLVEVYSATWCEPCLVGDLAIEKVAARHGLEPHRGPVSAGALYYQPPGTAAVFLIAIFAGIGLAFVKLPGGRE